MDVKQILVASLLCGIAGCATVESAADHARDFAHEHPVATGIGVALVVGGIAVAATHHLRRDRTPPAPQHTCAPPAYTYCAVSGL